MPSTQTLLVEPLSTMESNHRLIDMALLGLILVIALVVLLLGALPTWRYSRNWGYAPGGLLGTLLVIFLILLLLGYL